MNHTFSRVAAFCGLSLSYYITAALLAPAFVVLALTGYRSATPLYILLAMAVSPLSGLIVFAVCKPYNIAVFPCFSNQIFKK